MKYMQLDASNIILFVQQLSGDKKIDDMATMWLLHFWGSPASFFITWEPFIVVLLLCLKYAL